MDCIDRTASARGEEYTDGPLLRYVVRDICSTELS